MTTSNPAAVDVRGFIRRHEQHIIDQLREWVAIPSVQADPERAVDVRRSARWLAGAMRAEGLATRTIPTGDTCAVFGERRAADPNAPTVLVYSHHDVRAAKPEIWQETDPFTAVVRDGRLYGRGASDAKGQVLAHLWGLRAHVESQGEPAVHVKYLIESEEETGSAHLLELLRAHRDLLSCDLIVFSDTIQWAADSPAIVTSMRGTITAELTVRAAERDVHSGAVSGATANPIHALAGVIGALHDEHGRIQLPRFYDSVIEPTARRREELARLPFDDERWRAATETFDTSGERGYTVLERLWTRPSLEVLEVAAGDPEGFARAVIPAEASAAFSIRTVPNQEISEVADQLREFVARHLPGTLDYTLAVDEDLAQPPYLSPEGSVLDALARAMARAHDAEPGLRMGNAGGGPARWLVDELGAPLIFVGTGLVDDHWHANDESVDLGMLRSGAEAIAHLWEELGSALRR